MASGVRTRSILGLAGALALGLGVAGVLGFLAGAVFSADLPAPLRYANFGAAILEASLGLGLYRRRRAAWAMLIALEWTLLLINLLGLPQLVAAGGAGIVAIGFAAGRAVLAGLLTLGRDEV